MCEQGGRRRRTRLDHSDRRCGGQAEFAADFAPVRCAGRRDGRRHRGHTHRQRVAGHRPDVRTHLCRTRGGKGRDPRLRYAARCRGSRPPRASVTGERHILHRRQSAAPLDADRRHVRRARGPTDERGRDTRRGHECRRGVHQRTHDRLRRRRQHPGRGLGASGARSRIDQPLHHRSAFPPARPPGAAPHGTRLQPLRDRNRPR